MLLPSPLLCQGEKGRTGSRLHSSEQARSIIRVRGLRLSFPRHRADEYSCRERDRPKNLNSGCNPVLNYHSFMHYLDLAVNNNRALFTHQKATSLPVVDTGDGITVFTSPKSPRMIAVASASRWLFTAGPP